MQAEIQRRVVNVSHLVPISVITVWKSVMPSAYMCGGAVRSFFDKTEVQDYDFFLLRKDDMADIISKIKKDTTLHKEILFECKKQELFSFLDYTGKKIQIICKNDYPTVMDLLHTFDFTCCSMGIDINGYLFCEEESLKDCQNMILYANTITYPVSTMRRIEKYIRKGYRVDLTLYNKLLLAAIELNKTTELPERIEFYHGGPWGVNTVD